MVTQFSRSILYDPPAAPELSIIVVSRAFYRSLSTYIYTIHGSHTRTHTLTRTLNIAVHTSRVRFRFPIARYNISIRLYIHKRYNIIMYTYVFGMYLFSTLYYIIIHLGPLFIICTYKGKKGFRRIGFIGTYVLYTYLHNIYVYIRCVDRIILSRYRGHNVYHAEINS